MIDNRYLPNGYLRSDVRLYDEAKTKNDYLKSNVPSMKLPNTKIPYPNYVFSPYLKKYTDSALTNFPEFVGKTYKEFDIYKTRYDTSMAHGMNYFKVGNRWVPRKK